MTSTTCGRLGSAPSSAAAGVEAAVSPTCAAAPKKEPTPNELSSKPIRSDEGLHENPLISSIHLRVIEHAPKVAL
jgi:hypothetical protein